MDILNEMLVSEQYWDPLYLHELFREDFYDFNPLWKSSLCHRDLVHAVETLKRYNPLVDDISLDDDVLCSAVKEIELEYKCVFGFPYYSCNS